jgi:hypothetical protein
MTDEGRQILYRVLLRCSEEWGLALARMEFEGASGGAPFEAISWHAAVLICNTLRNGFSVSPALGKRGIK